ncbi:cis-golgi transport vesicle tethering complex subunit [Gautieria morchelliformis]|nr:cis-golgi transport vesicle tethering complex subunit [Gautieria morchelliformis]
MASPRSSQRRPQAPTTLSPHPKPVISVEDWEAKSPLGEHQTRSVNSLKRLCEQRRLPLKFNAEEPISRPTTPASKTVLVQGRSLTAPSSPSRPSTPSRPDSGSNATPHHHLHPKHPIQTPEQFHDWFALIERSVAHSQEAHFRAHLETVSEHRATCEQLLQTVDNVEADVEGMMGEWMSVEAGGRSLKDACEKLLQERDRLIESTEVISLRLEYFQELDHATRMLNHPGESLVLQTDFLLMVERVDVCLEYLEAHRNFREAEIYLLRFQQCLTRAMTLIRMYFVGSLKALTADIQRRLSEKDVSETAQTHLLYSKFATTSCQVAPLLAELERRAASHPDDLASLLTECHAAYLSARKSLLVGRLVEDIKGLDPAKSELVELTRTGCSYLKQLCTDEFDLYRRFFNTGEDRLYHYLESLCDYLYDDLRPRILHEPRLTTLCEVCTVLQALMILDVQPSHSSSLPPHDDEDDTLSPTDAPPRKGLGRLHIKPILQLVLQDAQTRLLFKTQAIIQSDIRLYTPKNDDLDYPDKLTADIGNQKDNTFELSEKEDENLSRLFSLPSYQKQVTWYPTLRKTFWVLSQLHDFVNPAIFDDVAQEAIGLCRQSIKSASEELSKKHPESLYDGQLFLIRHLLILKDMTADLELKERDGPDQGMADALGSMLRGTSALFSTNGLLANFAPSRGQNKMNARSDIDHDLTVGCEDLISRCADTTSKPILIFIERCAAFRLSRETLVSETSLASFSLPEQDFASPTSVMQVDTEFRASCNLEITAWLARLQIYLEDDKTISILLAPLKAKIVQSYGSFRDLIRTEYPHQVVDGLLSQVDFRNFLDRLCTEHDVPQSQLVT